MIINKRCIAAFSRTRPLVALATKSKLFDPTFSLTSELLLVNYMTGHVYPAVTTEMKFCKILWCESGESAYLAAGHESGNISIYELSDDGLVHLKTKNCMDGDVTALEFLPSKNVLVAGSCRGRIIFWTLSDLEREYALDVPMSVHITALAWNPRVTKILCVGTADGSIKVLDIKKNTIIMTLNEKEISEVKEVEWDASNNTRLIVMSDKAYLSAFDLSNDTVTRIGNHSAPLIGFKGDVIVSKTCVERNGTFAQLKESFDCAVSERDGMVALSYCDGTTEILPVPLMPRRTPLCRVGAYVIGLRSAVRKDEAVTRGSEIADGIGARALSSTAHTLVYYTITLPSPKLSKDPFYDDLLALVSKNAKPAELAAFLLENAQTTVSSDGWVEVDLDDPKTIDMINGNLDGLKDNTSSIPLSLLYGVANNSNKAWRAITQFDILMAVAYISSNYSLLHAVKNDRVLAALLLGGRYSADLASLPSPVTHTEFAAIAGLISGDVNNYISGRISARGCPIRNLASVSAVMEEVKGLLTSQPLKASIMTDYFWYKVGRSEYEDVKSLNISNRDVEFYNKVRANNSQFDVARPSTINNLNRINIGNPANTGAATTIAPRQGSMVGRQMVNNPSGANTPGSQILPSANILAKNPLPNSGPVAGAAAPNPIPAISRSDGNRFNIPGVRPTVSNVPSPSVIPEPLIKPSAHQQFVPSMPPSKPQVVPRSPLMMGNTPKARPMPVPPASVAPPQHPNIPSRGIMDGFARQAVSPASNMQPAHLGSGTASAVHSGSAGYAAPSSVDASTRQHAHGTQCTSNTQEIVHAFDAFIAALKDRAANRNSLIIRQRKNQCLAALSAYDAANKASLPPQLLQTMGAIAERVKSEDAQLKGDIDLLVAGQLDCAWLRSVSELIKMLY